MDFRRKLTFVVLSLGLLFTANAEVVGLTEGQFRVDESGAATYNLPLVSPGGRAGVAPSISLSYSSNNIAEGPVGVGWSVTGMSSISRCPPTPIHDNKIQEVQYTNQDKLCLDGRRLILTSGTYLAPNSVYRFEIDDFSKIIARGGSSTNGPKYFEVQNKAGETHFYGDSDTISSMFSNHDDAFVEPGGFSAGVKAKMWMLKVVRDVKNNFILYNYTKDTAKGSVYLNNIQYSGNLSLNKQPFAKIQFVYRDYDKGFKGYYAGAHSYHDKLLERVDTSVDNDIFRSYFLRYEESDFIEEKTLLTSVQECPDADTNMSNCRRPITFEWQRPNLATSGTRRVCETEPGFTNFCYDEPYSTDYNPFPSSYTMVTSAPNHHTSKVFDINGDGFNDLVYVSGSYWYAKLGPTFGSAKRLTNIGVGKKEYAMSIDYDGDGVRDLLVANSKTSNWYAVSYQPSTSTVTHCYPGEPCEEYTYVTSVSVKNLGVVATGLEDEAQVMDVNGDGNEDIVFRTGRYIRTHLNDGDGTFTANKTLYSFTNTPTSGELNDGYVSQSGDMKSSSQIDINGDGRSDLIMKVTTMTGGCYVGGRLVPFVQNSAECRFDLMGTWSTSTSTKNHVYLASGSLLSPTLTELTNFSGYVDNIRVADFNGDGISDIAYVSNNKWYYRLSNGKVLLSPREMGLTTASNRKHLNQFVDLNGDGRADVLHATSTNRWGVYFSRPTATGEWISFQYRGTKSFDSNAAVRFGDVNGDGKLDMLTSTGSSWKQHYNRRNIKEFVISKITNGFGVATTIEYKPMTNTDVYVMQASDADINSETVSPISGASLVSRVDTQITNASSLAVKYQYGGMLVHKKGRGSLGFQMLRTIDQQTGVVSETQYSQTYSGNNFAKIGMPLYSEQRLNGQILSKATNSLGVRTTSQGGLFPYVASSTEDAYVYNSDGTSTRKSTTVTTNTFDSWGNPTEIKVRATDRFNNHYLETKTINSFGNSTEQRYGRLKQTSVVKNRTGDASNKTRVTTFTYRSDKLLAGSVISPSSSATKLTTAYSYDSYGNKTQTSVTGYSTATGSNQTRTSKIVYDSRGRYIHYEENAKGERDYFKYDGKTASSASGVTDYITRTDPNNISTTTYYDNFQQVRRIDYPDSRNAYTTRSFCSGCVTNSYFKITESMSGSPTKETYFDKWGREVTQRVRGFDGSWWSTNITYDSRGRQSRVYEPNSTSYTESIYDEIDRVEQIRHPNGGRVYQYYNDRESKTTDELGNNSYTYSNGFGETWYTKDDLGNTVTFSYDAHGNMTRSQTTSQGKSSVITNVFDLWGRKTRTTDPSKGTWNYTYNAFGELYSQKSARNHTTTFSYDLLGRKIRSYEASEGTLCWNYGTTSHSSIKATSKLLSKAKYENRSVACSTTTNPTIKVSYNYDSLSRMSTQTTRIGSTNYVQSQTYDSYSRPSTTTYPTGTESVASKTTYNSYGYAKEVRRVGDNYLLQRLDSMNSRGDVTKVTTGNNVSTTYGYSSQTGWMSSIDVAKSGSLLHYLQLTHDLRGNVKSRRSNYASGIGAGSDFTETYTYDDLNRLTRRTIGIATGTNALPSPFKTTQNYTYDGFGNIKSKTGVGYYKYHSSQVHKLLGVYTNSNFTGTKYSFAYDANGNMTNDGSRLITYSSFDKATRVVKGTNISDMKYGVDRDLYYKKDSYIEAGKSVSYERFYIGAYEKVVRTGGKGNLTEHKYNIAGATITYRNGSRTTSFVHKDNQGSVIATTNHLGQVNSQAIYDPFGKQSVVYQESAYSGFTYPPITDQGYTSHKQMNHVDLIHMGGRIYDPTLGRFLQADPNIQAPKYSQSYNRYSYVLNNPMSFTDPTGYFFKSLFKKLNKAFGKFAPFVGLGLMLIPGVGQWAAATWYNAAAIGFVSGGIATGSLKGALIGALSGAAFQQIGSHFKGKFGSFAEASLGGKAQWVGAHAVTGGISSSLGGGKFGHGFFSAGLTKAFNVNQLLPGVSDGMNSARIFVAALIGGTVSELTGGKFANGAATAALGQAVNGNSFWNKAKELGEFAVGFLPGADLVGCITGECSYLEWSLAVGEVALTVAGGGAITVAYKAWKVWKSTGKVTEGIYEFVENGKKYVGQSGNIQRRLQQHVDSGRLSSIKDARVTEVLGGKTNREIAEHLRIQKITGGVPARQSNAVTNRVDPIGPKRRHLLP